MIGGVCFWVPQCCEVVCDGECSAPWVWSSCEEWHQQHSVPHMPGRGIYSLVIYPSIVVTQRAGSCEDPVHGREG